MSLLHHVEGSKHKIFPLTQLNRIRIKPNYMNNKITLTLRLNRSITDGYMRSDGIYWKSITVLSPPLRQWLRHILPPSQWALLSSQLIVLDYANNQSWHPWKTYDTRRDLTLRRYQQCEMHRKKDMGRPSPFITPIQHALKIGRACCIV